MGFKTKHHNDFNVYFSFGNDDEIFVTFCALKATLQCSTVKATRSWWGWMTMMMMMDDNEEKNAFYFDEKYKTHDVDWKYTWIWMLFDFRVNVIWCIWRIYEFFSNKTEWFAFKMKNFEAWFPIVSILGFDLMADQCV